MNNIKWVFFDLDDTLWDFSNNSEISLKLLYFSESILENAFFNFKEFNKIYHAENDRLWNLYHNGLISTRRLKSERFSETLKHATKKTFFCSEEIALRLNEKYLDILIQQQSLIPGALKILDIVRKNYLIGIITNGFINTQYRKLYGSGLWQYIQRMIVSDEIGIQKPSPEIFNYALQETGCRPEQALMIGDNINTDITGALSAGLNTIYFHRHTDHKYPEIPCNIPTVSSLFQLEDFLA